MRPIRFQSSRRLLDDQTRLTGWSARPRSKKREARASGSGVQALYTVLVVFRLQLRSFCEMGGRISYDPRHLPPRGNRRAHFAQLTAIDSRRMGLRVAFFFWGATCPSPLK